MRARGSSGPGGGVLPRALVLAAVAAGSLVSKNAWAHVGFDGLQPGATFVAGTTAEIRWVDLITHDTTAYHLSFIPSTGAAGVPIADFLPTEHSTMWQVPATPCSDCSLYIVQDNASTDYTATLPIMIVSESAGGSGSGGAGMPAAGSAGTGGSGVATGGTVGTSGGSAGVTSGGTAGTASGPVSSKAADGGCSMVVAPRGMDALALAWLAGGMALWRRRRRHGH